MEENLGQGKFLILSEFAEILGVNLQTVPSGLVSGLYKRIVGINGVY